MWHILSTCNTWMQNYSCNESHMFWKLTYIMLLPNIRKWRPFFTSSFPSLTIIYGCHHILSYKCMLAMQSGDNSHVNCSVVSCENMVKRYWSNSIHHVVTKCNEWGLGCHQTNWNLWLDAFKKYISFTCNIHGWHEGD